MFYIHKFVCLSLLLSGLYKQDTLNSALRVARDGPAGLSPAKRGPPRPLAPELYEAHLDLSHLRTTNHAASSTASSLNR